MDLEKFIQLASDPRRSKEELQQMLRNAIQKGEPDFARAAKDELDRRFPNWETIRTRKGGATPTLVEFQGLTNYCQTAKEAYVWLVERIIQAHPEPFANTDWKTAFVAEGKRRNYFSRNLQELFYGSQHLADDRNNYVRLTNGWYANLNLSNKDKFELLAKLAAVTNLTYGDDWKWKVEGGAGDDCFLDAPFSMR